MSLAPSKLRSYVRAGGIPFVLFAAFAGATAGLCVSAMSAMAQLVHEYLYPLSAGHRLSALDRLPSPWYGLIPAVGGIVLGIMLFAARKRRRPVDPIEANALYGGRLSMSESATVVGQNLVSTGFGASVGLEAGYTQISSALASRLGQYFALRRDDMRVLVGCGAAGAIGAAFGSPLAGAFYAFELVIGSYTAARTAPVIIAALCGNWVNGFINPYPTVLTLGLADLSVRPSAYVFSLLLGLLCALIGIAIMRGVSIIENAFHSARVPIWSRPVIGGLFVGGVSILTPQVLSSGHGALHLDLIMSPSIGFLAMVVVTKALASMVSLGCSFRGGLFFASLLIGCLFGNLYANVLQTMLQDTGTTTAVFAIVGMGALAVTVIGGPLTMTFLGLELSGNTNVMGLVLVGVITAALTTRRLFGYNFATWRFHMRGQTILGAHDVGWIRNLSAGQLMRKDVPIISELTTLADFRQRFPLGSIQRVVAINREGAYRGIAVVAEVHATETKDPEQTIEALLHARDHFLLPGTNPRDALTSFDAAEAEALAVVDDTAKRHVLGILTESHLLKRYSEELDSQRIQLGGAR